MSLKLISTKHPLIHCLTNQVVMTQTANALLAVGASPIMTDEPLESKEITSLAQGILVNIGTMTTLTQQAMTIAIETANQKQIPIVLDPVGVGASAFRFSFVDACLTQNNITVLRCNQGELATIAREPWITKGVDSGKGDVDCETIAKRVATDYHCIVVVTGKEDIVTDGKRVEIVRGGHDQITRVTGTGCMLGALLSAGIASVSKEHYVDSCVAICQEYKQLATKLTDGLGHFPAQIITNLAQLTEVEQ